MFAAWSSHKKLCCSFIGAFYVMVGLVVVVGYVLSVHVMEVPSIILILFHVIVVPALLSFYSAFIEFRTTTTTDDQAWRSWVEENVHFSQHISDGDSPYTTCAICLVDYAQGHVLAKLPCGHTFHKKCFMTCFPYQLPSTSQVRPRLCPLCRSELGHSGGGS